MKNPFLKVLRKNFESLYRHAAEHGERTAIIVPCAECLEDDNFSVVFVETHLLRTARIPGCYMNLVGQGVEVTDTGVSTHLGFMEQRSCELLQSESMYDFGHTFRVFVTDKPLIGKYNILPGAADRSPPKPAQSTADVINTEWLDTAPNISHDFYDQVARFRKTYVRVAGCEQSMAERIREITAGTAQRLIKHHKVQQSTHLREIDIEVSHHAYVALHSTLFPHLKHILAGPEEQLGKAMRSYPSARELAEVIPGARERRLDLVDVGPSAQQLALMDREITPHGKISCIDKAHSLLQQSSEAYAKAAVAAGGPGGAVEITGDDILSLFILAAHASGAKTPLAHVAHVEMYLQTASGRSGGADAARLQETGYAVSAFQAALQFILDEKRRSGATSAQPRATTQVFASYLQNAGPAGVDEGPDSPQTMMGAMGAFSKQRRY